MINILRDGAITSDDNKDIIPTNAFGHAADNEKGMSRKEIHALLGETYANNDLRDYLKAAPQSDAPKTGPQSFLKNISHLTQRLFHAVVPEREDIKELGSLANEATPVIRAVRDLTREI